MKRLVIGVIGALVLAVPCSVAHAQGRGRGHLKHGKQENLAEYREVVLPSGTSLRLSLTSPLASDSNNAEDPVRATLREPVVVDRQVVLPKGTPVVGYLTEIDRSGRVKGRARLTMRFSRLTVDGDQYDFRSAPIERVAESTKGEDATKIGIGAGTGAAIGAIVGGASGAAKGAAIGGAAGTGAVLATRGDDVRLAPGQALDTHLTSALPIRVPIQ